MSMEIIKVEENGIHMVWGVTDKRKLLLLHLAAAPYCEADYGTVLWEEFVPVEVMVSGGNCPEDRLGNKMVHSSAGVSLCYLYFKRQEKKEGPEYCFYTEDAGTGLTVELHYQFYKGLQAMRCHTVIHNQGKEKQGIENVTSFSLHGLNCRGHMPYEEKLRLNLVHNGWQKELEWEQYTLPQLGLAASQKEGFYNSSKMISISNTGAWSTKEYLPLGILENKETGEYLAWQIEHNGSWHFELAEHAGSLYVKAAGPTELYAHWYQELKPSESFKSVPVGIVLGRGDAQEAAAMLTEYRRRLRRPHSDNVKQPVIFNDYMNCLFGNPTTQQEIPLIDAAAECGCEYYCIDCGWYSGGAWWDSVGEWVPSLERFPEGIEYLLSYIRSKGMIPGLWLEIEVMGLNCPLAGSLPDEWFFMRHGKRVCDKSRYQLDFRNPEVREYASGIIRRLTQDYGVGYIKMDYNIEPGIGTEYRADSMGAGLLAHSRAYLEWLEGILEQYPALIIENCSSGGMRMDYAMLSRHSIQSTSDMEDYRMYSTIAVNAPLALTPEQAAVWSYPMEQADREETIYNMVNVIMLRIHQSGHLCRLSQDRKALVQEAISYYKSIREDKREAVPFWPLGFCRYRDTWAALGLRGTERSYVAVWRRGSRESTCILPVRGLAGQQVKVRCAYPREADCGCEWEQESGSLRVDLPQSVMGRIFEITV